MRKPSLRNTYKPQDHTNAKDLTYGCLIQKFIDLLLHYGNNPNVFNQRMIQK